jgi:hypothetical protein
VEFRNVKAVVFKWLCFVRKKENVDIAFGSISPFLLLEAKEIMKDRFTTLTNFQSYLVSGF